MAARFVTGIDTDGEVLGSEEHLTILAGGAITVADVAVKGVFSNALAKNSNVTLLGSVATAGDSLFLKGSGSTVFVGQLGAITSRGTAVSLGSTGQRSVSLRNEGTITGIIEAVRLQGAELDLVNTGMISVGTNLDHIIAAVTMASSAGSASFLTNSGQIVAGLFSNMHSAVVGGAGTTTSSIQALSGGASTLVRATISTMAGKGFGKGQASLSELVEILLMVAMARSSSNLRKGVTEPTTSWMEGRALTASLSTMVQRMSVWISGSPVDRRRVSGH
ncbi:hypothetical protein [Microvirga ossetica]|uniref:hypothetical protein n=1 Tax=Microvirga ossetica TaxID=1882682 RepID=UPI00130006DF|nr:hypothetical protein [Microvirga ossetica]